MRDFGVYYKTASNEFITTTSKKRILVKLSFEDFKEACKHMNYYEMRISTDEDKMILETDVDNPDNTTIGIGGKQFLPNKKGENIHKHISNIRKYINKF